MMTSDTPIAVRRLTAVTGAELQALSEVLLDCVAGGASIGFMQPMAPATARAFWQQVADGVARGERALWVAEDAHGIAGTVQLALAMPENQAHRADLCKLQVHRRARGRGIGAALLRAAEAMARDAGKTLLVLDTVAGSDAERLYTRAGWQRCGQIPGYARLPDGPLCATVVYYRQLPA